MNIIHRDKGEIHDLKYTLYVILSWLTFKKVSRIERRKKELFDRLNQLDISSSVGDCNG